MTLYEVIRYFEKLALVAPNVRTASDGDVYAGMNDNPELQYGVFFITQDTHLEYENYDSYGLTLFYIDRLDDTLEDNRLQIQSIGKEVLSTIIRDFCEEYDVDLPTMNYTPFTQKFKDLTAGIYVQITLNIFKDTCYDDYSELIKGNQTKTITITSNGTYSVKPDQGYDALDEVVIIADVDSRYTEGYNDGEAAQKAKLVSTAFTQNGEYVRKDGWNKVNVNIDTKPFYDSGYTAGYDSGRTDGIDYQKSLLTSTAFTQNGTFRKNDGWNEVTVNVPTGDTINNQNKSVEYTQNGVYNVSKDSAYTGMDNVQVTVNIDTKPFYDSGYTDGYGVGYDKGEDDGIEFQKSLIQPLTVSQNGTYTYENGYNPVIVNVPSGYTQEDLDEAYNKGYEDGLNNRSRLTVSPTNISQDSESGQTTITVSSNTDWIISSYPDWIVPSITAGTGNANVTITINENTGSSRNTSIVFKTTDNVASATTKVNQSEIIASLSVVPASNNLNYSAQTLSLTVTANTDWNITDYPSWAVPSSTSGNSGTTVINVTIPENTGGERRGYLTFNTTYGSVTESVYIRQGYNSTPHNYAEDNLTFTVLEDGTITWYANGHRMSYSVNNAAWREVTGTTGGTAIATVSAGDVVRFRSSYNTNYLGTELLSPKVNVSGNIMSIVDRLNYQNIFDIPTDRMFEGFFRNTQIVSAENLVLPATGLTEDCYRLMFKDNQTLTKAPKELPATVLKSGSYYGMFSNCKSLTTAPEIAATTVEANCCEYMFYCCTNLRKSPTVLPATTLKSYCYAWMFYGCSLLNTVPSLPATTLATSCYQSMFQGCSSISSAPVLPARQLFTDCYKYMFEGCHSLSEVTCYAYTISGSNYTYRWLSNVKASGTFYALQITGSDWERSNSGVPSRWTLNKTL